MTASQIMAWTIPGAITLIAWGIAWATTYYAGDVRDDQQDYETRE